MKPLKIHSSLLRKEANRKKRKRKSLLDNEKKMKNEVNPVFTVFKTQNQYLGEKKKKFVFYSILFFVAGIIEIMEPLVIGLIFIKVQQQITSYAELKSLIWMIFLIFAISIGFWTFHGTARVMQQRTGFFVNRNYINSKLSKVFDLPVKWHKDHHSGDTIDKINRGAGAISTFSRDVSYEIYYAIINIVGSVIILFFFDTRAAILALIFSFFTIYLIYRMDLVLNQQYKEINLYSNKVAAGIFDYISNVITVITLRLKTTVKKEIDHLLMASWPVEKKNVLLNEIKWGFASISIALMTTIVLSLRAYTDYSTGGTILIGTLYILYGYMQTVGRTFFRFASLYGDIVRHSSRIMGAYPIDEEFEKVARERRPSLQSDWKEVTMENISFKHEKEGEELHIDNIKLRFNKGEKIAFIGESGSGKSTMLALLRGLMKPDSGKVSVNGHIIENGFNRIKHNVTLIPQDPELFNNTIKYNITMGLPTSEKDLDRAIELAQFKSVLLRLPNKLETNVLERGVSLSGGEKQRLALARGILAAKNSDILLMDEPTSSVDTINELKIYENILKEFKEKTIISAMHRLHLLRKFDYIYIFDKGRIVAEGTLNEIRKNPRFSRIWNKYHSRTDK